VIHLHDVDILLKLAACDLLDSLPELLEARQEEIRVLGTAAHKIRRLGKQGKYSSDCIERAVAFCSAHEELPDAPDDLVFQRLAELGSGMEAGEAVLFAVAIGTPDATVVSGDKRAITRLGQLSERDEFRRALQGRVICFEELLLRYLELHGYERLRTRCCLGLACDGMLRLAFVGGLATEESTAVECLVSYWRALFRGAGGLLWPRPELEEEL
jgi:hypothetical protein